MSRRNGKAAALGSRGLPEFDLLGSTVDRENSETQAQTQAKPRSGRRSRTKGAAGELEVLHIGQHSGFAVSQRSRMYKAGHDLDWPLLGVDRRIEVKRHANGQGTLYAWLAPVYAVIHRGDRRDWLVTLRLSDALKIAKAAEWGRE
jgi:hypothetical protein